MKPNPTNSSNEGYITEAPMEDEAPSMPLGIGEFGGEQPLDPLAGAGNGRKFGTGSLIIVAVVATAAVGLFFMRSLSHVSAEAGDNTQVEASIDKFLASFKGNNGKTDPKTGAPMATHAIAILSQSYTEQHVPLNDVQKNPFILDGETAGPLPTQVDPDQPLDKQRAARKAAIEQAAVRFELKSVIMSAKPLANISGKVVRPGDEIVQDDVTFRVDEISEHGAILISEDAALGLKVPITLEIQRDR